MKTHLRKWAVLSVAVTVLGATVAAGAAAAARQYFVQGPSATQIFLLPGGNPDTDSDIARLDTRTGAVYRFRGSVDNPSVTNTWEQRVRPVKGPHSGILEIQTVQLLRENTKIDTVPPPTTFLVDVVSGRTWILRERASTNASWEPVNIFR